MKIKCIYIRKWKIWTIRQIRFWSPELIELSTKPYLLIIYVTVVLAPIENSKNYLKQNQEHLWTTGSITLGLWGFSALLATLSALQQAESNKTYSRNAADHLMASGFRLIQSTIVSTYLVHTWHTYDAWYMRVIITGFAPYVIGAILVYIEAARHLFSAMHWVEKYIRSRE